MNKMNKDYEKTRRSLNSFVVLKKASWALCAVAVVIGFIQMAMGNHAYADRSFGGAIFMFIFACIFSNAAGYHCNRLSVLELQNQLAGSGGESTKDE